MTNSTKYATASQVIIRIWKNSSPWISKELMETVTVTYMDELAASGYSEEWRHQVLESALCNYEKVLEKEANGEVERNRPGYSTARARRAKALTGKTSWFLESPEETTTPTTTPSRPWVRRKARQTSNLKGRQVIESIMFVPHTPGGELRRRLTQMEQGLGLTSKVKYVEELGESLQDILVNKDPWGKEGCARGDCLPCRSQRGRCGRQGAIYNLTCSICKEEGIKSIYIGETARTCYDHGLDHLRSLRRGDKDHPMVSHYREVHPQS